MRSLIFGCGYLGKRAAQRWLSAGDHVCALTRSAARAAELSALGMESLVADVTDRDSLSGLPDADTVLFAVGYDRSAPHSIEDVYVGGLRNVLDTLSPETRRIVYVSSTGVYGQMGGPWVDEQSEARPVREGGRACLAAEQLLANHEFGSRAIVLRMAGIYGPGRIPSQSRVLAGEPIAAPGQGYLNLIHVEDAADIIVAAVRQAAAPRTYLVADGQPVLRSDYYRELARLLGAPPPKFGDASGTPAAARATADKRVNSARMMAELQVKLKYPSYREGLAAVLTRREN